NSLPRKGHERHSTTDNSLLLSRNEGDEPQYSDERVVLVSPVHLDES
ncbi:hypothetical protein PC119_g11188, partial [Phytophthora cactorum]